jgi:hypothetical protein
MIACEPYLVRHRLADVVQERGALGGLTLRRARSP